MRLLASWRNFSVKVAGRRLSRSAQRIAELGDDASGLGAVAAGLCVAGGLLFACLVNEPVYHRVGSAVILGVIPGLAAYGGGRLIRLCFIALSLAYDPFASMLVRLTSRLYRMGVAWGQRIGPSVKPVAAAAARSGSLAWVFIRRTPGTWVGLVR